MAPAMILPMETGRRLFQRKAEMETGAPSAMPIGTMNMLATLQHAHTSVGQNALHDSGRLL